MDIKEYFDKVTEITKELYELSNYSGSVGICTGVNNVLLDSKTDIQKVAAALGCEVKEREFGYDEYQYEYYFVYNNIEIVKISRTRLPGYGNEE